MYSEDRIANCTQRSDSGPLGLLLKTFFCFTVFWGNFPPVSDYFYYNKIRTNKLFLQIIGLVAFIEQNENDNNVTNTFYSCLPFHCFGANSPLWPLFVFRTDFTNMTVTLSDNLRNPTDNRIAYCTQVSR